MGKTARVELPPKLVPVFAPERGAVRYRGAYGGRGSAKSRSFAIMAAVWGYAEPLRILCTREFQNSIRESFWAEVKAAIEQYPWLADHYEVGESYIRGANGTEFLFKGLRHSMSAIRSMARIDLCIIEEAEDVPESSWRALTPTVRAPQSEIWAIWNPRDEFSPVDQRLIKDADESALVAEINYTDNPWFPDVLEAERRRDQRNLDPATYAHIWEGAYLTNSDAQVLAGKWRVAEFEPGEDWDGPYHGLDFGFSQDPTAATKSWIHDDCLYIEREAGGVGVELDDTAPMLKRDIPGIEEYEVLADNARPESISYLRRNGLPRCVAAKKWAGSVEDGVQYLRSFREIIIHPRCTGTAREARLYSYKVDSKSEQVLPKIADGNDHYWDSVRYGHDNMIRNQNHKTVRRKNKGL